MIDVHTHYLPEALPDLAGRFGNPRLPSFQRLETGGVRIIIEGATFREVGSNCFNAVRRLEECDRSGVKVQVLSTVPVMFSYWAPPATATEVARMLNDDLAEVVGRHPGRFIGLGTLPMQAPDLAVAELARCVGDLGLAGVQIGSHVNAWNLDAPELFSVFEAADDMGAAVFVHPWDMLSPDRLASYWLPWLVGMPTEQTIAICSLVFGGVLERLPRLRVCLAHGGGSFFGTWGRIAKGFEVRPDLVAIRNSKPPSEYMGRFWVDSLVHDPALLALIADRIGPERIVLGTDYPFPLGEQEPGDTITAAFSVGGAPMVWENAFEWLGLPPP